MVKLKDCENSEDVYDEKQEGKRRPRKTKKQNDKEIIYEYRNEIEKEQEKSIANQKKIYENIQHLSQNEIQKFESRFTKPKNQHQDQYAQLLGDKTKKIVVATGPAGTGVSRQAVRSPSVANTGSVEGQLAPAAVPTTMDRSGSHSFFESIMS
jgi:phosphate starvation-inducible protein PhoH